jgi:hypothetical protein
MVAVQCRMRLRRSNYPGSMEVKRSSCTLYRQVQYRSPGLRRAKKATAIGEKLSVKSDIEVAKKVRRNSPYTNECPTSGPRRVEITAKQSVIGSFMCRISLAMWPFLYCTYLGPSHLKGNKWCAQSRDSQGTFDTRDLQANLITGVPC